jgi:hypothetical protein
MVSGGGGGPGHSWALKWHIGLIEINSNMTATRIIRAILKGSAVERILNHQTYSRIGVRIQIKVVPLTSACSTCQREKV